MSNEKNIAVMSAEAASAVERFLVETGGKLAEASEEVKTYDIAGSTYAMTSRSRMPWRSSPCKASSISSRRT